MILLLFLGLGALSGADKLDRTYLPPPGSKFAGGSPDAILPPIEYPKESIYSSTTFRPQAPGFETQSGLQRGTYLPGVDNPQVFPGVAGQGGIGQQSFIEKTPSAPSSTISGSQIQPGIYQPGRDISVSPGVGTQGVTGQQPYHVQTSGGPSRTTPGTQAQPGIYQPGRKNQISPEVGTQGEREQQRFNIQTPGVPSRTSSGNQIQPGVFQPGRDIPVSSIVRPQGVTGQQSFNVQTSGGPSRTTPGAQIQPGVYQPDRDFPISPGVETQGVTGAQSYNVQTPGGPSRTISGTQIQPGVYQPDHDIPVSSGGGTQVVTGPQSYNVQTPGGPSRTISGTQIQPGVYQPGRDTPVSPGSGTQGVSGQQPFNIQTPGGSSLTSPGTHIQSDIYQPGRDIPHVSGSRPQSIPFSGQPSRFGPQTNQIGQVNQQIPQLTSHSAVNTQPGFISSQASVTSTPQYQNGYTIPTTTTSYAFTQTTTYSPSEEDCIGPNCNYDQQGFVDSDIDPQISISHQAPDLVANIPGGQVYHQLRNGTVTTIRPEQDIGNIQDYQSRFSTQSPDLPHITGVNQHLMGTDFQNRRPGTDVGSYRTPSQQFTTLSPNADPFSQGSSIGQYPDSAIGSSTPFPITSLSTTTSSFASSGFPIHADQRGFGQGPIGQTYNPAESAQNRTTGVPSHRLQADDDRNAVILNYDNEITPDGRFAYSYDTSNGIHADQSGTAGDGVKAQGAYSYTGDDGKVYSIIYSADENGYQPKGDHLPTPPPIPEAILRVIEEANRAKAAGISDDGLYDEAKYGYKKYEGAMERLRPQKVQEDDAYKAYKPKPVPTADMPKSEYYDEQVSEDREMATTDSDESVPQNEYDEYTRFNKTQPGSRPNGKLPPTRGRNQGQSQKISQPLDRYDDRRPQNKVRLPPGRGNAANVTDELQGQQILPSAENDDTYYQGESDLAFEKDDDNQRGIDYGSKITGEGRPSDRDRQRLPMVSQQGLPSQTRDEIYDKDNLSRHLEPSRRPGLLSQQGSQRRPSDRFFDGISQGKNDSLGRQDDVKQQRLPVVNEGQEYYQQNVPHRPTTSDRIQGPGQRRPSDINKENQNLFKPSNDRILAAGKDKSHPSQEIRKENYRGQESQSHEGIDENVPQIKDYNGETDEYYTKEDDSQRRMDPSSINRKPMISIRPKFPTVKTGVDSISQATTRRPTISVQDEEQINGYQYIRPSNKFDQGHQNKFPTDQYGSRGTTFRPFMTDVTLTDYMDVTETDDQSYSVDSSGRPKPTSTGKYYTTVRPASARPYVTGSTRIRPIPSTQYNKDDSISTSQEYQPENIDGTGEGLGSYDEQSQTDRKPLYETQPQSYSPTEPPTRRPIYGMQSQRPGQITVRPERPQGMYRGTKRPVYYPSTGITTPGSLQNNEYSSTSRYSTPTSLDQNYPQSGINQFINRGDTPTTYRPSLDGISHSTSAADYAVTDRIGPHSRVNYPRKPEFGSDIRSGTQGTDFYSTTSRPYSVTSDAVSGFPGTRRPIFPSHDRQSVTSPTLSPYSAEDRKYAESDTDVSRRPGEQATYDASLGTTASDLGSTSRPSYDRGSSPPSLGSTRRPYGPQIGQRRPGYSSPIGQDYPTTTIPGSSDRNIEFDGIKPADGTEEYENKYGFSDSQQKPTADVHGRPISSQERVKGEDFSGPKQPQKFDPETGYHY